jgi:hypothetical protein
MLIAGLLTLTGTYALFYPILAHRKHMTISLENPPARLIWYGLARLIQTETIQEPVEFSDYDIEDVETWLVDINTEWNELYLRNMNRVGQRKETAINYEITKPKAKTRR